MHVILVFQWRVTINIIIIYNCTWDACANVLYSQIRRDACLLGQIFIAIKVAGYQPMHSNTL